MCLSVANPVNEKDEKRGKLNEVNVEESEGKESTVYRHLTSISFPHFPFFLVTTAYLHFRCSPLPLLLPPTTNPHFYLYLLFWLHRLLLILTFQSPSSYTLLSPLPTLLLPLSNLAVHSQFVHMTHIYTTHPCFTLILSPLQFLLSLHCPPTHFSFLLNVFAQLLMPLRNTMRAWRQKTE